MVYIRFREGFGLLLRLAERYLLIDGRPFAKIQAQGSGDHRQAQAR